MKLRHKLLIISCFLLRYSVMNAQVISTMANRDSLKIRALNPGDQVPELKFEEVINHTRKTIDLKEYRGKLIILSFWSTYCSTCLKQLPKTALLQKEFNDDVFILTIGFDGGRKGSIKEYFEKSLGSKLSITLPIAIQTSGDKNLEQLFPFKSLPREIWIDRTGKLIGISDHKALTAKNINSVLKGEITTLGKIKEMRVMNTNEPFLLKRSENYVQFGSAFSGYNDSIANISPFGPQLDSTTIRLYDANRTPIEYYKLAYQHKIKELLWAEGSRRIIIDFGNKPFFIDWKEANTYDNWQFERFKRENLFCYELIRPKQCSMENVFEYMANDLDNFFGIVSSIQKKSVKCIIIKKNNRKIHAWKKKWIQKKYPDNYVMSINNLSDRLNITASIPYLVINEGNKATEINEENAEKIILPQNLDFKTLKSALYEQGLDLKEEMRLLDMLVLKARNGRR